MPSKILVVDDEEDISHALTIILERENYLVESASNTEDCVVKVLQTHPDLIILDLIMPGTPVIRILDKIKHIPLIFLSTVRQSEAIKDGMIDPKIKCAYVEKPFNINDLLKTVKKSLK